MLKTQNQQLKDLIVKGRLDQAMEEVALYTQSLADQHYHNAMAQLSARWKANERAHNLGTLSNNEYNTERNKVNQAVLALIDELSVNTKHPPNQAPTTAQQSRLWKKIGYAAIVVGILGGFAGVCNFVNLFPNKNEEALQLTVYVQGVDKKPIDALQNTGRILVRYGNASPEMLIGQGGRCNFGEIPPENRDQKIDIVLIAEGYEPILPDKKYKMDGQPVYFLAKPDNSLGLIQGIVKDRSGEMFIEGALVMIDQETTLSTDSLGRFRIILPLEKQHQTYTITVKKNGYKVKNEYYKPRTGPMEIRLDK